MALENTDGERLLDQCFNILFEDDDEIYLMYLLEYIPKINKYLHEPTKNTGWLPLFRVLNLFQM